jgi:hypothetical protein
MTDVSLRIDRLVVETEQPVDAFAFRQALTEVLREVVQERGVPDGWSQDTATPAAVIEGLSWDGTGGERGLAYAVADRLYGEVLP